MNERHDPERGMAILMLIAFFILVGVVVTLDLLGIVKWYVSVGTVCLLSLLGIALSLREAFNSPVIKGPDEK